MFKIYLRVFKILFKGVQHIYNTHTYIYIYIYIFFTFNKPGCASAHPHHKVEPPVHNAQIWLPEHRMTKKKKKKKKKKKNTEERDKNCKRSFKLQ
jgi:hypothetical protein